MAAAPRALRGGAPGLQGRADRRPPQRLRAGAIRWRPSRSTPTGPFTDLCRGPHAPSDLDVKAFKLQLGRGRLLAGGLRPHDADPHLRHRVLLQARAGRAPGAARAGQGARPSQARARAATCSSFSELSPGSPFWKPAGMAIWNELAELWRDGEPPPRLPARSRRRSSTTSTCGKPVRPLGQVQGQHVLHRRRGPADGSQADELPGPHPDLQGRAPLLPRPADPLLRGGARAPPRAERRRCTACCGCATSPRTTPTSSAPRSRCRRRSSSACASASSHL